MFLRKIGDECIKNESKDIVKLRDMMYPSSVVIFTIKEFIPHPSAASLKEEVVVGA